MVHDKCTEMDIKNTNTIINIRITYIIGDHDQDNYHITHITHSHYQQILITNMATVNRIKKG